MRTFLSRLAERDLEEIVDYIASDDPRRALSFLDELRGQCARIGDTPLAFPLRAELGAGIRSSLHGRYVIFFRMNKDRVLILRILHGARDLPNQFRHE
ncbi:type II toxin-antitoxin system RelE/ParE family toxin [Dokdonella sp.]|uniref:type II toxin-antitoxin system RelE/ParE family toxin n=1 Tax=Dokdonella sp. TaxID=2291710 RepID=UPI001B0DF5AA|nr:type II toxin-antitoxin system RelE/ParE family toxin [Dokdonella sp.]MBO9663851.1 type II toxin-antitoxin system RelE/ParE family toxin [Dokdonella sp.]